MRMFAQDGAFYRRIRVDETEDAEARDRLSILEGIDAMRERFSAAEACRAFGVSRATYYEWRKRLKAGGMSGLVRRSSRPRRHPGRQWTMDDAALVLGVRREMPWAGKARVAIEAAGRRPGRPLSTATVGRILAWGVETGRVRPCSFCEGRVRASRRRDFGDDSHAQRWTRDDWHRGVQADHMTLNLDGRTFKSFRAVCPRTRRQHARVYSRATSAVARSFLREVVEKLSPESVQVDGGSEFMGVFEDECAARALPLKVLPPRSPELNGMVERANRSERIECWSQHRGDLTCAALLTTPRRGHKVALHEPTPSPLAEPRVIPARRLPFATSSAASPPPSRSRRRPSSSIRMSAAKMAPRRPTARPGRALRSVVVATA